VKEENPLYLNGSAHEVAHDEQSKAYQYRTTPLAQLSKRAG